MPAAADPHACASVQASAAEILALNPTGTDRFVGEGGQRNHVGGVFGGRFIAQGLRAALHTVGALPPSSLHASFLAAGNLESPLAYRVERLRDSRRFAHRQVFAEQDGQLLFTMLCAFHEPEAGYEHQTSVMPAVPPPEEVLSVQDYVQAEEARIDPAAIRNFAGPLPVELRPVDPGRYFFARPQDPRRELWFRVPGAEDFADPRLHACLAAYASDYWLAGTSAVPHDFPTNTDSLQISSMDHAMWFHHPLRCDDWLLHATDSPAASHGLGLSTGAVFDRSGRLVASTAQECLLRRRVPTPPGVQEHG